MSGFWGFSGVLKITVTDFCCLTCQTHSYKKNFQHLEISLQLSPGPVTPSCSFSFFLPFFFLTHPFMHRLGFWTQSLWVDIRQECGLSESEAFDFPLDLRWTLCCKHETLSSLLRHSERWKLQSAERPFSSAKRVLRRIVWVLCCRMGTCSLVSGLAELCAAFAVSGVLRFHERCWCSFEVVYRSLTVDLLIKNPSYAKAIRSFVYLARLTYAFYYILRFCAICGFS